MCFIFCDAIKLQNSESFLLKCKDFDVEIFRTIMKAKFTKKQANFKLLKGKWEQTGK